MNQQSSPTEEAAQKAVDAKIYLFADNGYMRVEMLVEPPEGDGADVDIAILKARLAKEGVVQGIDEHSLELLAMPTYNRRLVVAEGRPAQDGENGSITELFPRTVENKFTERADGTIDYKELGLINDVKEGTVIMEITPPTKGVDGVNTKGAVIRARDGVKATPPLGENTRLINDGARAETTVRGNLVFRNNRFTVETVYRVQDIGYDIGNITFSGDVMVNGDIMDGFEIHAGGNVILRGQVGAVVVQGQNITIDKGVNGTGKGILDAVDTVKAGFIENCTVRAGKKVTASSIINSQVECEGDIEVTSGKGIICGGKVTAFGSIVAKEVGNDSSTLTIVTLGVTPRLLKERKRLIDQLADVTRHIEEMIKNVSYIERLVADGRPVPADRVSMLQRAKVLLPISEKKQEQLTMTIDEIETRMMEVNNSTLSARIIHPPTKVSIGAISGNLIERRESCRVYKNKEGELVFGSY